MVTLNAVGYATGEYMGSTVEESDEDNEEEGGTNSTMSQDVDEQGVQETDDELNDSLAVADSESFLDDEFPVLISYDCESTGGRFIV